MSKKIKFNVSFADHAKKHWNEKTDRKVAVIVPFTKAFENRPFQTFLTDVPGSRRCGKSIVDNMKAGDIVDITEKTLTDQVDPDRPDVFVWRVIDKFEDRFEQLDYEKRLASKIKSLTEHYDSFVINLGGSYLCDMDVINTEFDSDAIRGFEPTTLDGVFANTGYRLIRELNDTTYSYIDSLNSGYNGADVWEEMLTSPSIKNVDVTILVDETYMKNVNDYFYSSFINSDIHKDPSIIAAVATGKQIARQLADTPANVCTPTWLKHSTKHIFKTQTQHGESKYVRVLDMPYEDFMRCGGLRAVAAGSDERPSVTIMEYIPPGVSPSTLPTVVLIGKGVTFDAGGISIKPSAKMNEMKYDMCGAAAVIGTMSVLNTTPIITKCRVIGIVPATENLLNGHAVKPGDVIKMYDNQTVEVNNTDAEGRLILADMIAYAKQNFSPIAIIDIATLTGAISGTLDGVYAGLFGNNGALPENCFERTLAHAIQTMGTEFAVNNELVWTMPIHRTYDKKLESKFADMANIGPAGAGGSVAACFLKRFVGEDIAWAHLDIAGTAWNSKGATGWGVYTLVSTLMTIDGGV